MHKLLSDIVRPCWMAFAAIALTAAAPCALPAADDENIWTWMNGPSRINQETTFGTQGEASLSSSQGGRYEFSFASAPDGRLWVFGGVTHYAGSGVILDDLWQFNPSTLEWTWMKGSTTDRNRRISGTLGVPSPDNTPGSRTGSVLWCDNSGDLWLFGGKGYVDGFSSVVVLSDLWKFNPQTRQWTWVKGHSSPFQPPVYGNMGQADPANTPGARMYASGVKDSDGALWLFGGAYPDFTAYNNGLWRFTPDDENWTWIKGEDPFGLAASYGTMGVESPANTPGGRHKCVLWADQNGRIWMFGGHGRDVVDQHGRLSDLWRLDTSNGNWIWMKGPSTADSASVHGPLGVSSSAYHPSGRDGTNAWSDISGNLWLFAGTGTNDLWNYSQSTGTWAWVGGGVDSALPAEYGEIGVPSSINIPGGRIGAATWRDNAGYLWMYGGLGVGDDAGVGALGDVWRLNPGPGPLPSSASMWSMYE